MKQFSSECVVELWSLTNTLFFLASSLEIPRLVLRQDGNEDRYSYKRNLSHTVFYYQENTDSLFIGGTDEVLRIDLKSREVSENYTLSTDVTSTCSEGPCENVITTIEEFMDGPFVCGTNGERRQCWRLYPKNESHPVEVVESYEGVGIAPLTFNQNSLTLSVDGDLYAAAPLSKDGSLLQFRRKAGKRTNVWMHDRWLAEPTFISAFLAPLDNDPDNEKIYVFFREKNSDNSPEADPWISRVARVCKVDEGGSKRFFQNIWTSFLKARLACGIPGESLYFNRLQDIFIQKDPDWRRSRVYALFSSSWNSTAVCIYSLEEIDKVFEESTFKGFNGNIPSPRPGTCVSNSKTLPIATIAVVKDHSEMTDWIRPVQRLAPFYISNSNYTKIVVDQVPVGDTTYNVILLATESGTIHKLLESTARPFIISETHLYNINSPIHTMKLDAKRRRLLVGYPGQMSYLDLQRCKDYNRSCEECVLARDPYCSWTTHGCTANTSHGIQNIENGFTDVCRNNSRVDSQASTPVTTSNSTRVRREIRPQTPDLQGVVYRVPPNSPVYLSCPVDSYHATYTWEHGDQKSSCQRVGSSCLHLIPAMDAASYGDYLCVSSELDYSKVVTKYQLLRETRSPPPRLPLPPRRGGATTHTPATLVRVVMAMLLVLLSKGQC